MTVTIKVKLGNEAMQDANDVTEALGQMNLRIAKGESGSIRDINGNTVGTWKVG